MPLCKECQSDLSADAILCLNCGAAIGVIAARTAMPKPPPIAPKTAEIKQAPKVVVTPEGETKSFPAPFISTKSKIAAGLLALFLGAFGAHHFYLGAWGWGMIPNALFVSMIFVAGLKLPDALGGFMAMIWTVFAVIAVVRSFLFFFGSQAAFEQKYNQSKVSSFTW